MSKIEEYIFSDVEIHGVMGAANDEVAIDTGKKLIYIRKEDVIAMAEHFGLVVVPVQDLKRCHDTGYWTDAMIKEAGKG